MRAFCLCANMQENKDKFFHELPSNMGLRWTLIALIS
ncbi:hypothetical protein [Vibrio phage vB_VpaS_CHI]|nr:hypothetical protein [Vibrio phage vB_VpaS_ALK]USL90149.1 hypothetical protein [Vibrio phage vB_VpaS_CHI]